MKDILENEKYDRILQDNAENIVRWTERINYYKFTPLKDLSDEERKNLTWEVAGYLHEFLKIFVKFGKFKDTFENPSFMMNFEGLDALVTSEKTKHRYEFGFDYKGLYLQTSIYNAEYLKNVPDSFWELLLKLSQFGEFSYQENASLGIDVRRKYPHLFKPTKSNIFRLQRNYFLWDVLYSDNYIENGMADIGFFVVRWPADTYTVGEVLTGGCEVFKILYQLDYLLWKASRSS